MDWDVALLLVGNKLHRSITGRSLFFNDVKMSKTSITHRNYTEKIRIPTQKGEDFEKYRIEVPLRPHLYTDIEFTGGIDSPMVFMTFVRELPHVKAYVSKIIGRTVTITCISKGDLDGSGVLHIRLEPHKN